MSLKVALEVALDPSHKAAFNSIPQYIASMPLNVINSIFDQQYSLTGLNETVYIDQVRGKGLSSLQQVRVYLSMNKIDFAISYANNIEDICFRMQAFVDIFSHHPSLEVLRNLTETIGRYFHEDEEDMTYCPILLKYHPDENKVSLSEKVKRRARKDASQTSDSFEIWMKAYEEDPLPRHRSYYLDKARAQVVHAGEEGRLHRLLAIYEKNSSYNEELEEMGAPFDYIEEIDKKRAADEEKKQRERNQGIQACCKALREVLQLIMEYHVLHEMEPRIHEAIPYLEDSLQH